MRLITLAILFLIPLTGFASFPIQISIPSDTIIESKKETMEEYKIRIQKQLKLTIETKKDTITENKSNKNYDKADNINSSKKFKILNILSLLFLVVAIVFAVEFNMNSQANIVIVDIFYKMTLLISSFISFILSILLYTIQNIINRRKKRKLKNNQ
jgi:hypothetical protein